MNISTFSRFIATLALAVFALAFSTAGMAGDDWSKLSEKKQTKLDFT